MMKSIFATLIALTLSSFLFAENNTLSEEEKKAGFVLLFDGKTMNEWRNYKREDISKKWVVENETLTLSGRGGMDLITKKQYDDFELLLEWNISKNGNSGIFIHGTEIKGPIYKKAIEIQILDSPKARDVHQPGAVYDLIPAKKESIKKQGEWNKVRILSEKGRVQTWHNGVKVADFEPRGEKFKAMIAKSKFKNWQGFGQNEKGHIGLQDHGNKVSFRNIKIREIK